MGTVKFNPLIHDPQPRCLVDGREDEQSAVVRAHRARGVAPREDRPRRRPEPAVEELVEVAELVDGQQRFGHVDAVPRDERRDVACRRCVLVLPAVRRRDALELIPRQLPRDPCRARPPARRRPRQQRAADPVRVQRADGDANDRRHHLLLKHASLAVLHKDVARCVAANDTVRLGTKLSRSFRRRASPRRPWRRILA